MKHCIDSNYIGNKCFIGKSANFHVIDANEGCSSSSSSFRWNQFEIRHAHHKLWFCVNIVAMNIIWLGLRVMWEIISFNQLWYANIGQNCSRPIQSLLELLSNSGKDKVPLSNWLIESFQFQLNQYSAHRLPLPCQNDSNYLPLLQMPSNSIWFDQFRAR